MQRLQHQGADAADQHAGEITVYLPAHRLRTKQTGIALGVFQVQLAEGEAGEADDLSFDAGTNEFHVGLVHREVKYGREAFAVTDRAMLRSHEENVHPLKRCTA